MARKERGDRSQQVEILGRRGAIWRCCEGEGRSFPASGDSRKKRSAPSQQVEILGRRGALPPSI
jgi:hypothetical protein